MITFKKYFTESVGRREVIALVPGSFKPPHKGHYEMVEEYSNKADKVIVLISTPGPNNQRETSTGKIIAPEIAKQIFDVYTKHLPNVDVVISPYPSPVTAAYEMLKDLQGKSVILGASKKDNDWKRWVGAGAFVEKEGLDVDVQDPELTAVKTVFNPGGEAYSASNIRKNFNDLSSIEKDVPDGTADEVSYILSTI